jgi:hypothetical protein
MRKLSHRLATLSIPLSPFRIPQGTSAVSALQWRGKHFHQIVAGLHWSEFVSSQVSTKRELLDEDGSELRLSLVLRCARWCAPDERPRH